LAQFTQRDYRWQQLLNVVLDLVRIAVGRDFSHYLLEVGDRVRAKMQAEARKKVFTGTDWATAAQIADLAGLGQKNPSGTVNRWKQQRQIFALHVNGQDWYPKYALDENFRPVPAIAEVMAALADWRAERLASWFEAKSSSLGGQRPRELIATNPQMVVDAAKRVAMAEAYNG